MHERRRLGGRSIVLMYSLHVVKEVVTAREAVAGHSSLTVPEVAQMGPSPMAVHTMCLPLVTEKACGRRELHTNAGLLVATERLEVRVDILAERGQDTNTIKR